MIKLPYQVSTAIDLLNEAGFEAYIVGGCVRDFLLHRTPYDFDITTNALPAQTYNIFKNFRRIDIGKAHGTIAVIIDNMQIEITTYRIDGEYNDKRRPEKVSYTTSLKKDLARRDFTINAMAYNSKTGLVDYFDGKSSIEKKEIKCVGNPTFRFEEDALRIMRAVRFSSQLDFSIEEQTKIQIFNQKENLMFVSAERIRSELDKLLLGKNPYDALMKYSKIIAIFIPEILSSINFDQKSKYHKYTVWEHSARTVQNSKNDIIIKLTMLLHDLGKPETFKLDKNGSGHFKGHPEKGMQMATNILKRLKYDNQTIKLVPQLIKYHDFKFTDKVSIKKLLSIIGEEQFKRLLDVQYADSVSKDGIISKPMNNMEFVSSTFYEIIKNNECFLLKDLKLNGNDIVNLGITGEKVGQTLAQILNLVIEEKLKNEYDELLGYVVSLKVNQR